MMYSDYKPPHSPLATPPSRTDILSWKLTCDEDWTEQQMEIGWLDFLLLLYSFYLIVHVENGVNQILENNGHAAADFLSLIKVLNGQIPGAEVNEGTFGCTRTLGPNTKLSTNLLGTIVARTWHVPAYDFAPAQVPKGPLLLNSKNTSRCWLL